MIYNYRKLLGKIKEVYGTQHNFAKEIGMCRTSLNQRLRGKLEFSQNEINKAVAALGLGVEEIPMYFFTLEVEKTKPRDKKGA